VIVVVASGNAHKVAEIQALTGDIMRVHRFDDVFGYAHTAVEDGLTFEANAIKKIDFLPLVSERVYLSDDSGLEVDALDGRPGIYSARYAGEAATSLQRCEALLSELDGVTQRQARFRCVIALRFPDGRVETVNGVVEGHITSDIRGADGFGYDPIFIPDGYLETFAEMSPALKNKLSHRGQALRLAMEKLLL
jgi:non-canonical purine NTP pyrophosphatase (RdgB/HAM1 family)